MKTRFQVTTRTSSWSNLPMEISPLITKLRLKLAVWPESNFYEKQVKKELSLLIFSIIIFFMAFGSDYPCHCQSTGYSSHWHLQTMWRLCIWKGQKSGVSKKAVACSKIWWKIQCFSTKWLMGWSHKHHEASQKQPFNS